MRMSYDAVQLVTEMVRQRYDEQVLNGLLVGEIDSTLTLQSEAPITHDNLRLNGRELRQLGQITQGLSLRELLLQVDNQDNARAILLRVVFLLHVSGLLSFEKASALPRRTRRR